MFNFNARQILLTYPKCTMDKEEVRKTLEESFNVEQYTISRENHADGTPHIHAVLKFTKKFHTKDARRFDMADWHPNIKVLKTLTDYEKACKYVQKDGDYITNVQEKVSLRIQLIQELIEAGPNALSDPSWLRAHPACFYLNFENTKKWLSLACPKIIQVPNNLDKKRHIWLWGPSNSYKSTYLRAYRNLVYNHSEIPLNNDFSGINEQTELLWLDEFRGQLSIQFLNRLCDGDTKLNTKGGSTAIGFATIFIVSNFQIRTTYPDADRIEYDSMLNRFIEYDSSISFPPLPRMSINSI